MYGFNNFSWSNREILLPNGRYVKLEVLFWGGMEKEDIREIMDNYAPNEYERQKTLDLRMSAGEILTELGITPRQANLILFNMAEKEYDLGNREEWVMYAHGKLAKKGFSCAIYVVLPIVILILYLIFS